jgi:3D (Asp-Asp-Asp) domain-containing protein
LRRSQSLLFSLVAIGALSLSACGTTERVLPPYEPPLTKTDFQNVRTTAYTHTESDHREYSNRNALGGELRAAGPPIHRAEAAPRALPAYEVPRAIPVDETVETEVRRVSHSPRLQPFSMSEKRTTRTVRTRKGRSTSSAQARMVPGSAAADWSRWPAGTVFRLLSTGQTYRVEDYGWALSGRNTIDLYMANQREMNSWGAREESIQILQWGDPEESLQFLRSHQNHKHIKRMVLELEGRHKDAAALR